MSEQRLNQERYRAEAALRLLNKVSINEETGCWEWTGATKRGYGVFCYQGRRTRAHRMSYSFFNGPITGDLCVLHTCDVKNCVNPDHLYLGTAIENMRDALEAGVLGRLSFEKAQEIREFKAAHPEVTNVEIAKGYGVSAGTIGAVVTGKTWRTSPARVPTAREREIIVERAAFGESLSELAAEVGVHPSTVAKWVKKFSQPEA